MIVISYNVRGCGNLLSRKRIQQLLEKGKMDLCMIQKTKMKGMNDVVV